MRFIKLLISEDEGGISCLRVLPQYIQDGKNVQCEVTQCTCIHNDRGCSVIMITDPDCTLKEEIMERERCTNEYGEVTIDRISSNRLIAIVNNNDCKLSRIISDSGCFLTSGRYYGDNKKIIMTVMGPNTTYLQNLVENIRKNGYAVEKISSSSSSFETMLSAKQEEILRIAFENGYYEIPRKITLEQLSKIAGCTKSTLDTTLRYAENKIISYYYLGNQDSTRKS